MNLDNDGYEQSRGVKRWKRGRDSLWAEGLETVETCLGETRLVARFDETSLEVISAEGWLQVVGDDERT